MPDDRVEIRIVADASGVREGGAQASAAMQQMKVSATDMAAALKSAGGDLSKISPAMLGVGEAAKLAGSATAAVAPAMRATGEASAGMHGSISTATREFRALFDELSSGRTRQTPGTLAIIAQRVFGLGPAALGAVGAVAALAGGLGYLAVRAAEASNAIGSIQIGAAFSGNFDLTREATEKLVTELSQLGESTKDADKIVGTFARIKDATAPEIKSLTALVTDYATAANVSADKAAEGLAKMFEPSESATKLVGTLGGMSDDLKNEAALADKSGEAQAIFSAKLDALSAALKRASGAIDEQKSSIFDSIGAFFGLSAAAEVGVSADKLQALYADAAADARKRLTQALKDSTAAVRESAAVAQAPPPKMADMSQGAAAIKEQPGLSGKEAARETVQFWQSQLQTAEQYGGDVEAVMAKLSAARAEYARVSGEAEMAAARESASQIAANDALSNSKRLAETAALWKGVLASDKLTADQRIEVQRTVNDTLAELDRARTAEATKSADETTRALTEAYRAQMEIVRQSNDANLAAIREANAGDRAGEIKAEMAYWQERIRIAHQGSLEQMRAERGLSTATQQLVQQQQQEWQKAMQPVATAFDSAIMGMITKTETFRQSVSRVALSVVTDMVRSATEAATQWIASELAKTTATVAGEATRTAAQASGAAAEASISSASKLQSAGRGAAAVYADVASIPYVGWLLAPPAAAAAFAAMMAFEQGTMSVPQTGMAMMHAGEIVVPADVASGPSFKSGLASLAGGGSAPAGGAPPNFSMNLSTLDARSVQQLFNNPVFSRMITGLVQRGTSLNPSMA